MKRNDHRSETCPYCTLTCIIRDADSRRMWNRHCAECQQAATQAAEEESFLRDFVAAYEDPDRSTSLYVCGTCFFSHVHVEHVPEHCPHCTHGHMNDADDFVFVLLGRYISTVLQ